MSIRLKVFVIILVLFACMGGANFLIQRFIILPSFLALEYREAEENLRRIFYAIDREIVHLDQLCHDWAAWDDAYKFMDNQTQDFIASNLNHETLSSARLNLMIFCRPDGNIVWSYGADGTHQKHLSFSFLAAKSIPLGHPLMTSHASDGSNKNTSGVINTMFGPLLFSTQTILRSDGSGPDNGFLVMGRFLDTATLETLKEQTRIPFELIYPFSEEQSQCGTLEGGVTFVQKPVSFLDLNNGQFIQSCAKYQDITGQPVFGVQYLFPREITRKGITSMKYAAALAIGSGVIILIILNLLLQHVILRPIQRLREHASAIEHNKDFSMRITLDRTDEIGNLAHSLDTMVQTIDERTNELQLANEQLILLSVQDGLTGIANRRMFDNYLTKEWRRAKREQLTLSLILLDVDYFKKYNDTYGHQQGDRCLIAVAQTLMEHIRRPADLAARYGGEEFAVILPNTAADGAILLAERIREGVQALAMEHSASETSPFVSISLGVVSIIPSMQEDNQELNIFVETADRGLYQAKHQGRNRTVCAPFPTPLS